MALVEHMIEMKHYAANIVFTCGAYVLAVGINVTHQVVLTNSDGETLASSNEKFAQYLLKMLEVYFNYHHDAYSTKAMLAAINPSLITYVEGAIRVQTNGITRGLTLLYNKQKRFAEITEWSDQPSVNVAVTVDTPTALKLVMERLME
ncbi:hypothetical protein E1A91_A06G147900v1 [Gossypium mustelinum]|uniref:Inosine/uridine-preferring nucleoside hydrolase domain-containing protein n=1 Tax=Gossypium mustelinum TaxID=34275 RepID=A0A5D2YWN3_GOSMU|nr:hypothetical protein E1A91_A06G147900v1 [Gossypium mustelinum]